jgi:hypothetical protein
MMNAVFNGFSADKMQKCTEQLRANLVVAFVGFLNLREHWSPPSPQGQRHHALAGEKIFEGNLSAPVIRIFLHEDILQGVFGICIQEF